MFGRINAIAFCVFIGCHHRQKDYNVCQNVILLNVIKLDVVYINGIVKPLDRTLRIALANFHHNPAIDKAVPPGNTFVACTMYTHNSAPRRVQRAYTTQSCNDLFDVVIDIQTFQPLENFMSVKI